MSMSSQAPSTRESALTRALASFIEQGGILAEAGGTNVMGPVFGVDHSSMKPLVLADDEGVTVAIPGAAGSGGTDVAFRMQFGGMDPMDAISAVRRRISDYDVRSDARQTLCHAAAPFFTAMTKPHGGSWAADGRIADLPVPDWDEGRQRMIFPMAVRGDDVTFAVSPNVAVPMRALEMAMHPELEDRAEAVPNYA